MQQMSPKKSNEMSIKDVILKFQSIIKFLLARWMILGICGVAGAVIGVVYAIYKKPVYTATCSFVLEESKGSGLSQYANLASMVGVDLDGGGGGVFQGDNIIALYTSKTMILKTLLDTADFDGKPQQLVNRFVGILGLREQWAKKGFSNIRFDSPFEKFSRLQDSLLMAMATVINKKVLSVSKPDKKLSIINVDVHFEDEQFAKIFNDKLVANVNQFYISSKTQKAAANVAVLQKQLDSVKQVLNSSISGVAAALDAAPNVNPNLLSLRVPSQRKQVDVQASSAVYAEVVKNLELAKIGLMQDKPLIQIIDNPIIPLEVHKTSKTLAALAGFILAVVLAMVCLGINSVYHQIMNL